MESCIKDVILPDFLGKYGTEAVGMMFKELTQEEAMEMSRQDGYTLGVERGEASGRAEREIEMARDMKEKRYSIDEISELTGLSPEKIDSL